MGVRSAIVVGGGISGLAAAIALHGRGWQVRVLERAPRITDVGAGISLWANALRAFDRVGVGERIRSFAVPEMNSGIRSRDGRFIVRVDAEELARRFGAVVILHRADLLDVLVEAAADLTQCGVEVLSVSSAQDRAEVRHAGGVEAADLVIGADGIHSAVRRAMWPQARPPRYAGYTAWRTVVPPMSIEDAGETWGPGMRFGYAGLPDGRVYCYATANLPAGERAGDELAELRARFADWHEPIPAFLRAANSVLRHDIYELPDLPSFVRGRVALVGDAAHAMTPNLGQGAGQAVEDVATLAALLDDDDVPEALARYDALRRRHTQAVVRRSRIAGRLGQWSSPLAVALRDRVLAALPIESMMIRQLRPILDWRC
ncbi:MAG: FAD-dependent monooxygenase [Micromonosporaceae bacterium]|nr:FAD-dependent monooxygenase [Micromonosporaceae bacterium]